MSGSHRAQVPTRTTPSAPTPAAERQPVWRHGVASAVVASVATTILAAIASAAGVSFADSTGASIPIAGFAQLTLVFSLVGVGIAAVMARKARRPRATFVRTAVALTAVSFVPDLPPRSGATPVAVVETRTKSLYANGQQRHHPSAPERRHLATDIRFSRRAAYLLRPFLARVGWWTLRACSLFRFPSIQARSAIGRGCPGSA